MRTNKLLAIAAVALLIINGVLVYLLWNERKKPRTGGGNNRRGDWFAEQLKLDSTQKKEHKKLRDAHFESMKPLFDSISSCKTSLYNSIKESAGNDSLRNSYYNKIAELHKEITLKTYKHFKQVRTLLNPEQQTKYDEVVQKMMGRKAGPGGKPGDK